MRRIRRLLVVAVAAATLMLTGGTTPAGATECTPKGCTASCRGPSFDLNSLTFEAFECYS
ncbi:MAG TPA: hypothetical protein VNE62_11395 [Actinomycetota bacterium]|nr:hypothetical protein [Actinomycetota bacterium]